MRTTGNKNQSGSTAQFTQIAMLVGGDAFGQAKMPEQEATARIMELLHPVAQSLAGEQLTAPLTVLGQLASGEALPSGKLQFNWTNTCTALVTLPVDLVPRCHPQWKYLRSNLATALLLAYEQVDAPSQKLQTKVLSRSSELNGGQFNPDQKRLF